MKMKMPVVMITEAMMKMNVLCVVATAPVR